MTLNEQVSEYLHQNADRFVEELKEFLRIPTVSADPTCKPHLIRGAEFVHRQFANLGFKTEIVPTAGHQACDFDDEPQSPLPMVGGNRSGEDEFPAGERGRRAKTGAESRDDRGLKRNPLHDS